MKHVFYCSMFVLLAVWMLIRGEHTSYYLDECLGKLTAHREFITKLMGQVDDLQGEIKKLKGQLDANDKRTR